MRTSRRARKNRYAAPALAAALVLTVAACDDSTAPPTILGGNGAAVASTTVAPHPGTTAAGLIPQEDLLLDALHGEWTGSGATLSIKPDSTTTLVIHSCPTVPGGPNFGYSVDCPATTFTGHFGVGDDSLVMDDGKTQTPFGVYVDDRGRLHVGTGLAAALTGPRQALIAPRDSSFQITVDGDRCTKAAGNPVTTLVVACSWESRDGYEVLTVDDLTFLHDPATSILATPGVFYSVMTRSK